MKRPTHNPTSTLTLASWGRGSGSLRASLQLHMKDKSGASLIPRGPAVNSEGQRELGKSILENEAPGVTPTFSRKGFQGSWGEQKCPQGVCFL